MRLLKWKIFWIILKKIIFDYWAFQRAHARTVQILFEIIDLEVRRPFNDIRDSFTIIVLK